MNQKSWERTPEDLKPIIEEVAGNPFRTTGGLNQDVYKTMTEEISAKGVELYNLTEKEQERWFKGFQEETRKWVAKLEKKGLPAREAVKMYNRILEQKGMNCPAFPPEWH